jgi:hypothetical protein
MKILVLTILIILPHSVFALDKNVEVMFEHFQNKIDGKIGRPVVAADTKNCPKGFSHDMALNDGLWAVVCKNKHTDIAFVLRIKASNMKVVGYQMSVGPNSKLKYNCSDDGIAKQFMDSIENKKSEDSLASSKNYRYYGVLKGMKAFFYCDSDKDGKLMMLAAEYSEKN